MTQDLKHDIAVRLAEVRDIARVSELCIGHSGGTPEARVAQFEAVRLDANAALFVALSGGDIIGYGKVEWLDYSQEPDSEHVVPGWYLAGLVIDPAWRRRGVGARLTRVRMDWLREHDPSANLGFFTNARNEASLALHRDLGFVEVTRDFVVPRVTFDGGIGVLCRWTAD